MASVTTLTGATKVVTDLTYKNTVKDLTIATEVIAVTRSIEWLSSLVDLAYTTRVTLTGGGGAVEFDLYGTLLDGFGTTISPTTIRYLLVVNREATNNYIVKMAGTLIRHASSPVIDGWVDDAISLIIAAGGEWLMSAPLFGYTIDAGDAYDTFTLDPGANSVEVDVIVLAKT